MPRQTGNAGQPQPVRIRPCSDQTLFRSDGEADGRSEVQRGKAGLEGRA